MTDFFAAPARNEMTKDHMIHGHYINDDGTLSRGTLNLMSDGGRFEDEDGNEIIVGYEGDLLVVITDATAWKFSPDRGELHRIGHLGWSDDPSLDGVTAAIR